MLSLIAAVERESEHPLAETVVWFAVAQGADSFSTEAFENVPGHGVVGVDGSAAAVIGIADAARETSA